MFMNRTKSRNNFLLKFFLTLSIFSVVTFMVPAFTPDIRSALAETQNQAALESDEVLLKVLHTNDTHAHVDGLTVNTANSTTETEEVGSFARLATIVKEIRAKEKNTLLLSAGDVFQGTLFFNFFKGIADFECMNKIGYDAMTIGNHEFDDGPKWLLEAIAKTNFDVVNSNVIFGKTYPAEQNKIKPYIIKEVGGLRVAVIGLITKDLFTLVNIKSLVDVQIVDPIEAISPIVREAREKADIIIVLSHMGLKEDLELAELVPEIDLIIGGHSHSLLVTPVVMRTSKGKQVVINQAYEKMEYVGEVNMAYSKTKKKWRLVNGQLIRLDKSVARDPEIQKIIDGYKLKLDEKVKTVIGEAVTPLIGGKETRNQESNLGDFITDAMMEHTKSDLAIINGGGIRSSINQGKITVADCINVFPFDNMVIKLTLKGSIIRSAFEFVAKRKLKGNFGGFLQVSKSVKVTYRDGKVEELLINGQPLNDNSLYDIAMSDFTAAGGDGFNMFANAPVRVTDGMKISDLLIEAVKRLQKIDIKTDGRIK